MNRLFAIFDEERQQVGDVLESESEARSEIVKVATDNPDAEFHLMATIDTCVLPSTNVQWGSKKEDVDAQ